MLTTDEILFIVEKATTEVRGRVDELVRQNQMHSLEFEACQRALDRLESAHHWLQVAEQR